MANPRQQHAAPAARQQAAAQPPVDNATIVKNIEGALELYGVRKLEGLSPVAQIIKMAEGVQALKRALPDDFVRNTIMPLQGTPLGFLTDRDNPKEGPPGYGIEVVKNVVVEAMLRGFNVVGNEFNIISSRFYGAKAGFERLVTSFPGLSHLELTPGNPIMSQSGQAAAVPFSATWRLNGQPMKIECLFPKDGVDNRIPVKINGGMGPDAILGKAYRKMYARIYQRLTGSSFGLVDGDASEAIDTTGVEAPTAPAAAVSSKATALDDMASQARQRRTSQPPPANDADVSAELVYGELAKAIEAWRVTGSTEITGAWSQDQRRSAYAWALANNDTSIPDDKLPLRPPFTYLDSESTEPAREPGEEG